MAKLSFLLLFLLAQGPLAGSPALRDSEVQARLTSLSARAGAEREAAQRWLVQNLTIEHAPLVEARVRDGDAEVRRRIERALSEADRHLGLALALAGSSETALREVGEAALLQAIERWNPRLAQTKSSERRSAPGASEEVATLALDLRLAQPPTLLEIELSEPLPVTLGQLARSGRVPLPILLEPGFRGTPQSAGKLQSIGPWDIQLVALAEHHGARLDAFGASDTRPGGFLVFSSSVEAPRTGVQTILHWLRLAARGGALEAEATRALAATGWPAWLGLLTTRWKRSEDGQALDALAVAASQGFVPPALLTASTFRGWLARAAAGDATDLDRSTVIEALGEFGAFLGDGSSTLPLLLEGWGEMGARGKWVRLVVLERLRIGDPEARRVAAELLAAPEQDVPAALRLQALRAFAAGPFPPNNPPQVGDARGLLAEMVSVADARRRVRLLARSGLRPAGPWVDLDRSKELPFLARLALLGWSWARGQEVLAARSLTALLSEASTSEIGQRSRGEALGELLRESPGEERRLLRLFEVARGAAAVELLPAIDRTALLAGALPFERRAELLKAAVQGGTWSESQPDLALLGAFGGLAGEPSAVSAREMLLTRLAANVLEEAADPLLLDSLQRALDDLYRSGQDPEAGVLLRRLHRTLGGGRGGWPSQRRRYSWPHPPGAPILELDRLERSLAPGALED